MSSRWVVVGMIIVQMSGVQIIVSFCVVTWLWSSRRWTSSPKMTAHDFPRTRLSRSRFKIKTNTVKYARCHPSKMSINYFYQSYIVITYLSRLCHINILKRKYSFWNLVFYFIQIFLMQNKMFLKERWVLELCLKMGQSIIEIWNLW